MAGIKKIVLAIFIFFLSIGVSAQNQGTAFFAFTSEGTYDLRFDTIQIPSVVPADQNILISGRLTSLVTGTDGNFLVLAPITGVVYPKEENLSPLRPNSASAKLFKHEKTPLGYLVGGLTNTGGSGSSSACGNGVCNSGETYANCSSDCHCGDSYCNYGETYGSCSSDCHCGDGVCNYSENYSTCSSDCLCGNGVCNSGETYATCASDCLCGNGVCNSGETYATCASDCLCGNGVCNSGESYASCPGDCLCGNGICASDENYAACPTDCSQDTNATVGAIEYTEYFKLGFFIDGNLAQSIDLNLTYILGTPQGVDNFSFSYPASLLTEGLHVFRVQADYEGAIPEANEINNSQSQVASIVSPNSVYSFDNFIETEPILLSFWVPKTVDLTEEETSIQFGSVASGDYTLQTLDFTKLGFLSNTHDLYVLKLLQPTGLNPNLSGAFSIEIQPQGALNSVLVFQRRENISILEDTIPNIYSELTVLSGQISSSERFRRRFYSERFNILAPLFWNKITTPTQGGTAANTGGAKSQ